MTQIVNVIYQWGDSFAFLLIASLGLAIIYGMMGIINQAHGEFVMVGAYIASMTAPAIGTVPAIIVAALGVGILGLVIDRVVICHLYDRPLDSIVATWGISLILSQGVLLIFGSSMKGISMPLASFSIGGLSFSVYKTSLIGIALALALVVYLIFAKTKLGLKARATMQNRDVAQTLGINTRRMYSLTFMFGSMLAGLAGGIYCITMGVTPTLGSNFTMQAFVTVVIGGGNPVIGALLSSVLLSLVNSQLSLLFGTFFGKLGMLIVAIIFIRVAPQGVTGLLNKYTMHKEIKNKALKGAKA